MLLSFKWLLVRFSVVLIIVTIYVSGNMYGRFLHITFLKTIWTIKNIYFLVYKCFVTISILYCILKLIWLESLFFLQTSSSLVLCLLALYLCTVSSKSSCDDHFSNHFDLISFDHCYIFVFLLILVRFCMQILCRLRINDGIVRIRLQFLITFSFIQVV